MRAIKTVGIVAIVLVAAILVYQILINNNHLEQTPATAQQTPNTSSAEVSANNTLSPNSGSGLTEPIELNNADTANGEAQADSSNNKLSSNYPPLAAYEIGNEPITDEALAELIDRLNNDPALMAELINSLRGETDPVRLKRLVYILGATENSAVLPAAEDLIYSGVTSSRDVGLDLLSRIAPTNPEAYAVASNLLISETDPTVLIATMNVIAQPGETTPELTESLVAQITPLATHESASVRGFSVTTLSRLSNDPSMSSIFNNALYDDEPAVRSAGVYAFSGFPYQSAEANQKLLDMLEDESETPAVRRGAMLALSNSSPDELTKSRIDAVGKAMRKRARIKRRIGN